MIGRIVDRGTISAQEIIQAYTKQFKVSWWDRLRGCFRLADETYKEADPKKIKATLEANGTDSQKYIEEDFDCDDFSFRLMGVFHQDEDTASMPIFITWVLTKWGGHAVLSYYHNGQITIIEPQNDLEFPVPEDWRLMLLIG